MPLVVRPAARVHHGRYGDGCRCVGTTDTRAPERGSKSSNDGAGKLGLHAEDVAAVGRVCIGPTDEPCARVGELRRHPEM